MIVLAQRYLWLCGMSGLFLTGGPYHYRYKMGPE